jgi:hypothetical protein
MMDDRRKVDDAPTPSGKRIYRAPELTEYGRLEDLVDAGVIGSAAIVPSITPKSL